MVPPVFKTGERCAAALAGSIPVRLRHLHKAPAAYRPRHQPRRQRPRQALLLPGTPASDPATVYVDGFTGDHYLDKPREVEQYSDAFESIWSAALGEAGSRDLIRQSAEELRK